MPTGLVLGNPAGELSMPDVRWLVGVIFVRVARVNADEPLGGREERRHVRFEDLILHEVIDVVYHLVEDEVFEAHMATLFAASKRFVGVYSSDTDENHTYEPPHVRHRQFTRWVAEHEPGWHLLEKVPNSQAYRGAYQTGSSADFYFFGR